MYKLLSRITIYPETWHGKPCIRGMRWSVEVINDTLVFGMTTEETLEDHKEFRKGRYFGQP